VSIAVVLSLLMPDATKGAADKVASPTVLVICFIGGAVSAFASTSGA
jgi:hypothetical protein